MLVTFAQLQSSLASVDSASAASIGTCRLDVPSLRRSLSLAVAAGSASFDCASASERGSAVPFAATLASTNAAEVLDVAVVAAVVAGARADTSAVHSQYSSGFRGTNCCCSRLLPTPSPAIFAAAGAA